MDVLCPTNKPVAPPARTPPARQPVAPKAAGKGTPAKGGGNAATGGPNCYAGYCYKCDKYVHRSTTCRVVMGIFDEVMGDAAPLASVVDGELK
eukprot:9438023-Heterocapsa_arctica.AAC.1